MRTETGILWKQHFGGSECMFSYLLLRREEGELLLTLQTAVRFLIHPTRLIQNYHLHQLRYLSSGI